MLYPSPVSLRLDEGQSNEVVACLWNYSLSGDGAKMEAASLDGLLPHLVASMFPIFDDQLQPSPHSSCSGLWDDTEVPQYYAQIKGTMTL